MPRLEGMYAPNNECAHILPPAGFNLPFPPDVFRFNRVVPHYPPDPCIRPNEGDLTCPPEYPPCPVNHPWMPAGGTDIRMLSDVFRFHKVYPSTSCNPCKVSYPCRCKCNAADLPCRSTPRPRYPPSKPARHFDFRYPAGPTDCVRSTHRHGHVPAECHVTFPSDEEIIYLDKPTSSDCKTCPPNGCVCAGQSSMNRNSQDYILPTQYPQYFKNAQSYNNPSRIVNNPLTSSGYGCSDASMYNNTSAGSLHGGTGDYMSTCSSGHYPMNGNLQYSSNSLNTDRDCFPHMFPFQKKGLCSNCFRLYFLPNSVCRPVYDRNFLADCPEQDGPPADTYTFL